ncbi:MAG TPA: class I SAM-dependent methyltransferase [Gemmataceae bacterium]|nr:class I SAM-dependent methyltransferase [Gemmataceae bacterium]
MKVTPRLLTEQLFHDRQAAGRASRFAADAALRFRDDEYLDHEPWIRPAFELLGDIAGKRVLDYGCGHGMASVVLARRGAIVTGIDLSPGYIVEAHRRAEANKVTVEFRTADAEQLPFADSTFDAIWGCAILHHLDLRQASQELLRVLKRDGVAVFCEPWGGNPLLEFARGYLPYRGKHRTPDEKPLRKADLDSLREYFPQLDVRGFQLFGAVHRVFRRESPAGGWLDRCDRWLFRQVPALEKWSRYMVVRLSRA